MIEETAMNTLRFLLLEDSKIDADLIQAILADGEIECELVRVETQADFLAALANHPFNLILADYSLPSFDGKSALELAQVQYPDLPFIFVSGTLGEEVAVEMLKGGATDYVLKQRLDRLVPAVKRALQESQEKIARKQAEKRLVDYTNRLQLLVEASRTFSESILDLQSLVETICRSVSELLGDVCILWLISEDEQWLQAKAVYHPDRQAMTRLRQIWAASPQKMGEGFVAKVLQRQKTFMATAISKQELRTFIKAEYLTDLEQLHVNDLLLIPLQVRERVLGLLSLYRLDLENRYTVDDQLFLQDLADRAALAIDNARLYQKSQEANRIKDEFLAVLSHELRSPLNAILGWLSLLRSRKFDEKTTKRALETVERNAKAQAKLVEDLLDVSRIIQGKLHLNQRSLELLPLVNTAIDTIRPSAEAKNVQLFSSSTLTSERILGDPERLQQIIWNLLSNAVKFTPQGGRIEVKLERTTSSITSQAKDSTQTPQIYAQLSITDSGKGIRREFLPYVFERFRQADSSITRDHGGLGLGLAIVRHLVDLHSGTVHADSPGEGQGATFRICLPLLLEQPLPVNPKLNSAWPEKTLKEFMQLESVRILIVDDDPDSRSLLTAILNECGATVIAVASASEALSQLVNSANQFEVLISDIGMPGEDGYSLLSRVRTLKPEQGGSIPAIAVTAYARDEDRKAAFSAGFQIHVSKPIDPAQLIENVAKLIGNSHSQTKYELNLLDNSAP